jgi:hypothetical protein
MSKDYYNNLFSKILEQFGEDIFSPICDTDDEQQTCEKCDCKCDEKCSCNKSDKEDTKDTQEQKLDDNTIVITDIDDIADIASKFLKDIIGSKSTDKDAKLTDLISGALHNLCESMPDAYGKKTNVVKDEIEKTQSETEPCVLKVDCSDKVTNDCTPCDNCEGSNVEPAKSKDSEIKPKVPGYHKLFEDEIKKFEEAIDDYKDEVKHKKDHIKDSENNYQFIGETIRVITSDPISYTAVYIQYKIKQLFQDFISDTLKTGYKIYPNKEYSVKRHEQLWTVEIPMDFCVHECIYDFDQNTFDMQMDNFFWQYGFTMIDWLSSYHNIKFIIKLK